MRRVGAILLVLLTGGCLQTTYRDAAKPADPPTPLERRVSYRLAPAFWSAAPRCTAIISSGTASPAVMRMVERTAERHLSLRLPRVIGASQVRSAERQLALDMRNPSDRRVFSRQFDCETVLEVRLQEMTDEYAVLWAERAIGLTLTLRQAADDRLLWTATHKASRGDGGLPLSFLSLPVSAARAAVVTSDSELFASIADDAVRRMVKTLPDLRSTAAIN